MTEQQDVAGEFLDSNLHMSMMYGSRIMEQVARAREQKAREQESEVREQTRLMEREQTRVERLQEQTFRDSRDAGRMKYDRVMHERFWETTSPQEIADTIETALRWRYKDPKAQVACQKIDHEMQARYGVSLADIEQHLNDREQRQNQEERTQQDATEPEQYTTVPQQENRNYAEQRNALDWAVEEQSAAQNLRAESENFRNEQADHEQDALDAEDPEEQSREQAEAAEAETKAEDAWDKSEERENREGFYESEFDEETANSAKYADRARGSKPSKTVNTGDNHRKPKRRLRDMLNKRNGNSLER